MVKRLACALLLLFAFSDVTCPQHPWAVCNYSGSNGTADQYKCSCGDTVWVKAQ